MYAWVSAALVAAFLWAVYIWRKKRFSLFKDLGVPGPEPSLLFGHLLEIKRRGGAILFEEWIKKYGNVVGFYNGARPFLLINDLDILKKVQIEDFHNFSTRGDVIGVGYLPDVENRMLINTTGSRWKELRHILSPAFSPNKLSQMANTVSQCTDTLIEVLKEKSATGESVEVTLPIRRATMDTMLKAGYGVDLNIQRSPPGGSLEHIATGVTKLLQTVPLHGIPFLSNCFPELDSFWNLLTWFASKLMVPYLKVVTRLIEPVISKRRTHQSSIVEVRQHCLTRQDFCHVTTKVTTATDVLQILLNKETRGELFTNDSQSAPDEATKTPLTKDDVDANAALYLVAGVEAAPNILGITLYLLALHPEIQEKLRSEVLDILKKEGSFTYKTTMKMTYLDMVLNESMRIYPGIVGFVTRRALQDYEVNGLKIPKGMSVMVPVSYLHLDPEVWHEPQRFDPERFSPENVSLIDKASFQPFGQGPRQCIGRNFALMQARLMMCKFISAFRVSVDTEHHKEIIKMESSLIAATIPQGVWLKLENISN